MNHYDPTAPVQPGQIIAGKYRIDRVLGRGAMGVVVSATHIELNQRVALKLLLAGANAGPQHRERFLREARSVVRLRTSHVARVSDVARLDDGTPYLVMEYLEGGDLADHLARRGPLPIPEAVAYILQALEALAEAHAAGLVHRDVKPPNLFLATNVNPDGTPMVKVLDFGIAKDTGAGQAVTGDLQALGSPLYMSPEQVQASKDVDARSDLWATGVTLYELLAGATPFQAESIPALCTRIFYEAPIPLSTYRADVPAGLVAVIGRCLEKDRNRRFTNAAELAAALAPYATPAAAVYAQRVAAVLGESARPAGPLSSGAGGAAATAVLVAAADTGPRATADAMTTAARPSAGSSRGLVVVAAFAAVALSVAVFFGLRFRAPAGPASEAARPAETAIVGAGPQAPSVSAAFPASTAASAVATAASAPSASATGRGGAATSALAPSSASGASVRAGAAPAPVVYGRK